MMMKKAVRLGVRDREAWLLASCIRLFRMAEENSGWLGRTDFNRILAYLKERFGNA